MKPISRITNEIDRLIGEAARIFEGPLEELSTSEAQAGECLNRARSLMWAIDDPRDVGSLLHAACVEAIARNNS
jgi:hypothetical protein